MQFTELTRHDNGQPILVNMYKVYAIQINLNETEEFISCSLLLDGDDFIEVKETYTFFKHLLKTGGNL